MTRLVHSLIVTCLLSLSVGNLHSTLWASDDQKIKELAERAKALFQRDQKIKAERRGLDAKIEQTLEKERQAARAAQEAASGKSGSATQEIDQSNLRWQEARKEVKALLKEIEPLIAELLAAEKVISDEKAKLQKDAGTEAQSLLAQEGSTVNKSLKGK